MFLNILVVRQRNSFLEMLYNLELIKVLFVPGILCLAVIISRRFQGRPVGQ